MARRILRVLNGLLSFAVAAALVVTILYAGFALWDNEQILTRAETAYDDMREIKERMSALSLENQPSGSPEGGEAPADPNFVPESTYDAPFDELRKINPDVNGWLTMPGTKIDYPLVQGETNFDYLNKDVTGEFALAGSIFLDFRNNPNYTDLYSLLYGHDMSRHRMFADVNLYKDETFFNENQTGLLYLPDKIHDLQSISCIVTNASNSAIFNPENWVNLTPEQIIKLVQEDAMYVSETGLERLQAKLDAEEEVRILALSTCSEEFTDARTILLTLIDP